MEEKKNESTPLRPEGEIFLNASLVEMDIEKYIDQLKEEVTWKASGSNSITLFKSDALRIVLIGLHKDAELKTHTAPGYISVQVMEGKIEFIAEQNKVILNKGQMIALQPRIPHSVHAQEMSFFLLTLALKQK